VTLTVGSLFSGIGGIELGLERAGMRCLWQCEIDSYCRRVLAKHWPDVRRWDDVRTFPPELVAEWGCDLVCGGFPCQDISFAGRGAGIHGERSSLWFEFARVLRLVRPRFVLVENVPALLRRGMGAVLGTLAALGFDAEWSVLPACALGAPHCRDRVFVLAHARGDGLETSGGLKATARSAELPGRDGPGVGAVSLLREFLVQPSRDARPRMSMSAGGGVGSGPVPGPFWWQAEPNVGRVAHGVPHRVDRLRGLGNAVVPQVSQFIGQRIVAYEQALQEMRRRES
jgi:DNA (cytosine-5)-methyltransferase 1